MSGTDNQGGATLETTLLKFGDAQKAIADRLDNLEKSIADASKPQYPYGVPNGAPHIRKGENPLSSRPYSLVALAKSLALKAANDSNWRNVAKVEHEVSDELAKAYQQSMGYQGNGGTLIPLGSDLMPTNRTELADGTKADGLPVELVAKCRDLMAGSTQGFDLDEYNYRLIKAGVIRKDMSATTANYGGTLVAAAAQGELIEHLRGMEVFSRAGAQQIDLPPQGKIRFPRQTSSVTVASTSESATVSESTPGTGALELSAKPYSGIVDIPDELMRFSTSVAVEMWLRQEFLRELALQLDRDSIYGEGGQGIQGIINYSGVRTLLATTVDTNGNTLGPNDLTRLYADIADQNAPVDRGFFFAMTNSLWAGLMGKRADSVSAGDQAGLFLFQATSQMLPNGTNVKQLGGHPVITSTQLPTNRAKGSASNLTLLLAGVGAEWVIGRAGIVEIVVTNSDASKFQQRISTMRGTLYQDAGPRHEQSFGLIDTLVNS